MKDYVDCSPAEKLERDAALTEGLKEAEKGFKKAIRRWPERQHGVNGKAFEREFNRF